MGFVKPASKKPEYTLLADKPMAVWSGIVLNFIFTIQYPVPLFSLCTKSLIAVLKDAKQLSEENGGGPFC